MKEQICSKGIRPAIVTPFGSSEQDIDEESLRRQVEFELENKVGGIVVLGSVGEFYALSIEERKRVVDIVIDEVKGRIPVFVGTGHTGTNIAVTFSKMAKDAGADGLQVVPPYYFLPSKEAVIEYYKSISQAVDLPIYVYNYPSASKVDVNPELLKELMEIKNLAGIKISAGSRLTALESAMKIRELMGNKVEIYSAVPPLLYYGLKMKLFDGIIAGPPAVLPEYYVAMKDLMREGKIDEAYKVHLKLLPFINFLTLGMGAAPVYPYIFKYFLKKRGIIKYDTVRKPLMPVKGYKLEILEQHFNDLTKK